MVRWRTPAVTREHVALGVAATALAGLPSQHRSVLRADQTPAPDAGPLMHVQPVRHPGPDPHAQRPGTGFDRADRDRSPQRPTVDRRQLLRPVLDRIATPKQLVAGQPAGPTNPAD